MRKILGCLSVLFLLGTTSVSAANPYDAVLTVNGEAITEYDISQRQTLLEALGASDDLRELATEQLTQDRIKVQLAARFGLELPEDAIQAGVVEFGQQRGLSMDQVMEILVDRGIDRQTMDDFVEAGLVWRELLASRFRSISEPDDADVDRALAEFRNTPIRVYQLGEIALPTAERGEADTAALANELVRQLRQGSDFATTAFQFSRSPTAQNGGQIPEMTLESMPPEIRARVESLSAGQVAEPFAIAGGLIILKVIATKNQYPQLPTEQDVFEARERLRLKMFTERITAFGDGYMQELVSDADIIQK